MWIDAGQSKIVADAIATCIARWIRQRLLEGRSAIASRAKWALHYMHMHCSARARAPVAGAAGRPTAGAGGSGCRVGRGVASGGGLDEDFDKPIR